VLEFKDVTCIETELEDINRVYRSDAPVRLGPDKLPCTAATFVVKRKTGMETYIAILARDIKRSLIYRVDPQARGVGDPSTQLKHGLDLLKGLGFELNALNLKYGSAMLEVVLQDITVITTPAKAKKSNMERSATLSAWENQAAYLEEHNLLDVDDSRLAKMAQDDRNRYNTAVAAYQKLEVEDHYDEQREFLFEHIDALLHGRTPPKPGSFIQETEVKQPTKPPEPKNVEPAPKKDAPKAPASQPRKSVEEKPRPKPREEAPAPKEPAKVIGDPKDKQRIKELDEQLQEFEEQLGELKERLNDSEEQVSELEATNSAQEKALKKAKTELDAFEEQKERIEELEIELEAAHSEADKSEREIRSLKSDNAKYRRKIEDLEDRQTHAVQYDEAPARPRSRLNTGRLLVSSSKSPARSEPSPNAPHVLRKPPPAGATFGVDWDLEYMPCTSLDQVVEIHQSICNAQLTLEGYTTQYCSAHIIIANENGGRQLFMVFNLTQERRFLIYKPIKKPTSNTDIGRLLKEAQKFLQVCGIETEKLNFKQNNELPSDELKKLFTEI